MDDPWPRIVRRTFAGGALLLLVLAATRLTWSPPNPARPIVIATSEWAPFVDPELEGGGPVVRVVTEAFQRAGFAPTVEYSSWGTVNQRLEQGAVVASFPFIASEDRCESFVLSRSVVDFDYVLFYSRLKHPNGIDIDGPDDLTALRVGKTQGYEVWPALADAMGEDGFDVFPTSAEAFTALHDEGDGGIDLLPEGRLPGRAVIESDAVAAAADDFGVVVSGDPVAGGTESLHILMPRTDEGGELRASLDEQLEPARTLYAGALEPLEPDEPTATVGGEGMSDDVCEDLHSDLASDSVDDAATGPGSRQATDSDVDLRAAEAHVELLPDPATGVVLLYDDAVATQPSVVAPGGTRGLVVGWSDDFLTTASTDGRPGRVQVKILNGPTRGRVFHVDGAAIRLSDTP